MDNFGYMSQCPSSLRLDNGFQPIESSYLEYNVSNQFELNPNQPKNLSQYYHDSYQQSNPHPNLHYGSLSDLSQINPQSNFGMQSYSAHDPKQLAPFPPPGPAPLTQDCSPVHQNGQPDLPVQRPPATSNTADPLTRSTSTYNFNSDHNKDTTSRPNPELSKPKPPPRAKTAASLFEKANHMELDQLIKLVSQNAKYSRLTSENELELNSAYREYQRQLYLIAYKNKLEIAPCLKYVGLGANPKGSTNYNTFCKYDPVASKAFNDPNMHPDDRKRECGRLWKLLDPAAQEKWKDPNYVESFLDVPDPDNDIDQNENENNSMSLLKKRKSPTFDSDRWARKVVTDLRNLSQRFGTEGFLVVGSRGKDATLKFSGGSHLGEFFLDMYSTKDDPVLNFVDFLRGQHVIKKITGKESTPVVTKKRPRTQNKPRQIFTKHDKGEKEANIEFIRAKLNSAIEKATHGQWIKGWPGTRTQWRLSKLKVSLQVKDNNCGVTPQHFCKRPGDMGDKHAQLVVEALEEDWVQLIGPPAPKINTLGFNVDGQTLEGDTSPTIVSVGKCDVVLKPLKSKRKQKAAPKKKRKLGSSTTSDLEKSGESSEEEDEDEVEQGEKGFEDDEEEESDNME
ncbi:hypothetical protein PTTG_29817 [Puccinia triticina 1-1 BBBD Race 1]|uniref:Uncharacterized protein n=1 Tax=Puccinia triticina (isolate 1-1 / race 1 (BBBD)) TaxID=630390 RepID=A0A180G1L8_PUCT1|nr:hypothetical protein PTTG_29817 [Puccinia triticina 1-1 BBBD Race 1]